MTIGKLYPIILLLLVLSCTTESSDEIDIDENQNDNNIENTENEELGCVSEISDDNEEFFTFDIDRPYRWKRINEPGDDDTNKLLYAKGAYLCVGSFNETFSGARDGNFAMYSLDEDLELNWMFPKSNGEFYDAIYASDDNYVAVGRKGNKDDAAIYAVKVDANGAIIWEYSVIEDEEQKLGGFASAIVESPDGEGYFVLGRTSFNSDIFGFGSESFVMYLNLDGEQQWVKPLGNSAEPSDVILTSTGNLIVVQNDSDILVTKVSLDGEVLVSNSFGSSELDAGNHVLELRDGNYLITGTTNGNDGDVTGSNGNSDAWLLRLDQNLNLIQEQAIGGFGLQSAVASKERSDGTFFVYGTTSNSNTFISTGWNQEWYLELSSELCVLEWSKSSGAADKRAGDMVYFDEENKVALFYKTNSAEFSNTRQDNYDVRVSWLYFLEE